MLQPTFWDNSPRSPHIPCVANHRGTRISYRVCMHDCQGGDNIQRIFTHTRCLLSFARQLYHLTFPVIVPSPPSPLLSSLQTSVHNVVHTVSAGTNHNCLSVLFTFAVYLVHGERVDLGKTNLSWRGMTGATLQHTNSANFFVIAVQITCTFAIHTLPKDVKSSS